MICLSPLIQFPHQDLSTGTDNCKATLQIHSTNQEFTGRIPVTRLRYSDVPKASRTWREAFEDDPLTRYIRETPDYKGGGPVDRILSDALYRFVTTIYIRTRISRTVEGGASIAVGEHAKTSKEHKNRRAPDRLIAFVGAYIIRGCQKTHATPQQRKRLEEIETKSAATIKEVIGDRQKDMLHLSGLATAPAYQGKGYGGAVLDDVTSIADTQGRATWLLSSNINNTEFYNQHGFVTVGTFALGDNDPNWNEKPVVISAMIREPEDMIFRNEQKAIV